MALMDPENIYISTNAGDGCMSLSKDSLTRKDEHYNRTNSDDSQDYKVEGCLIQEEHIEPTSCLRVYVTPSGEVKRLSGTLAQDGDDIDHKGCTNSDDLTSSMENCGQLQPSKRKVKLLEIDGESDFCRIETFTYHYDGHTHKHHYIKSADIIQGTGLKPLDELISVNEEALTDLSLKKVRKIFQRIKPENGKSEISMHLTLRRWKKSNDPSSTDVWTKVCRVQIWLTLVPVAGLSLFQRFVLIPWAYISWKANRREPRELAKCHTAFKVGQAQELESECRTLNPGCISDIVVGKKHIRIKLKLKGTDLFLESRKDGQLVPSVLHSVTNGEFWIDKFRGNDESPSPFTEMIFCFRLYRKSPEGDCFLISNLQKKNTDLCFKVRPNDDIESNIDERCFLHRCIGSSRIHESLIYRNHFMHYDAATNTFKMKYISFTLMDAYIRGLQTDDATKSDQFLQAERELDGCWFSMHK